MMIKPINQLFIDPFFCVSIYFPFPGFDPFQINSKCLRHLLHNSSVGLALPLSIKLISCLVYPISEPNLSMLRPFSFLICWILFLMFSLSTGCISVISPCPVNNHSSFTEKTKHILLAVSSETLHLFVSIREINPEVLLIRSANWA